MQLETACNAILDRLAYFDEEIAPLGLYAAGDLVGEKPQKMRWVEYLFRQQHPEWFGALAGLFGKQATYNAGFLWPKYGQISLKISKISKIKVRKFGSKYRIDKQENFAQRWEELHLDKEIGHVWSQGHSRRPDETRIVLFIGFDRVQSPFERELNALKAHRNREAHNIVFFSREWEDRYERNFWIRIAIWAHKAENST